MFYPVILPALVSSIFKSMETAAMALHLMCLVAREVPKGSWRNHS